MARKTRVAAGRARRTTDKGIRLPPDVPPQPHDLAGAPVARRDETLIFAIFDGRKRTRVDPYAWLKDDNWREVMRDPSRLRSDIRAYLEAENAYTYSGLETVTAALQEKLFEEMKGRIKDNDSSVPAIDGAWAYYRRFREGGEYPLFVRRPADRAFDGDQ